MLILRSATNNLLKQDVWKTPNELQMFVTKVGLESIIGINHDMAILPKQIDWKAVESDLTGYYFVDNDCLSIPILKIVGVLLLKRLCNLNDEEVISCWKENHYMLHFAGEKVCQKRSSISPFVEAEYHRCLGETDMEKIFIINLMVSVDEITIREMCMAKWMVWFRRRTSCSRRMQSFFKDYTRVQQMARKEDFDIHRPKTSELRAPVQDFHLCRNERKKR